MLQGNDIGKFFYKSTQRYELEQNSISIFKCAIYKCLRILQNTNICGINIS